MQIEGNGRLKKIARLRAATRLSKELVPEHAHLLEHLLSEGLRLEAETEFKSILRLRIRSADAYEALAFYARRLDQHELSNQLYRRATELAPTDPKLWHNLATSERSLGKFEEAVVACNEAIKLGGDPFPTLLLRSESRRASSENNHISELSGLLARARNDREKMFTGFALGKELHDVGEFSRAFDAFQMGAEARRRNLSYDVAEDEFKITRIMETFRKKTGISHQTQPQKAKHIFIVGLPRSGTTVTERILLGLSGTISNGETDNFASALIRAAPTSGGDLFKRCANANPSSVEAGYIRRANPYKREVAVIEKLPMNYLYAGAIANSISLAKIVWVRRHPVDSCFAMYRTLFAEAYPFSYDFPELARYFAAYEKLMQHWVKEIPDLILSVDYEQLVSEPIMMGKRIAEHCNLEWADSATDISRVDKASLTASASQVRGNIYTRSSGIWAQYEDQLQPLIAELERVRVM